MGQEKRKVILFLGMSLDGYIADANGGVDWMLGEDENGGGDGGFEKFVAEVDTVIMGRTTFDQIYTELYPGKWPYKAQTSYIMTHKIKPDMEGIHFTSDSPQELVKKLYQQEGKNIWICGGAAVVRQFMDAGLIDEYQVTILPVLLGKGIPLFRASEARCLLSLKSETVENGMVSCIYVPRETVQKTTDSD